MNLAYPEHNFYIFTDYLEKVDCPSSFSIIKTKREELYKKISELKEQIMPEPKSLLDYYCTPEIKTNTEKLTTTMV